MISNEYDIKNIASGDWPMAVSLIERTLNNSLLGWLGHSFVSIFYRAFSGLDYCCAYAAYDDSGKMAGVIIGSLDHNRAYGQIVQENWMRLLLAANVRVFRWSVLKWVLAGVRQKFALRARPDNGNDKNIKARLIVISVSPEFQGKGVAQKLVKRMEKWFSEKGIVGPYVIYTEQLNHRANRFYVKLGASQGPGHCHHGRVINKWYKSL